MDRAGLPHFIFGNSVKGFSSTTTPAHDSQTSVNPTVLRVSLGRTSPCTKFQGNVELHPAPAHSHPTPVLSHSSCCPQTLLVPSMPQPSHWCSRWHLRQTTFGEDPCRLPSALGSYFLLHCHSGQDLQFLQHQPEGNRVKEQKKILPADRTGSILTFCKWFPFIKAAHEWLVVVGCALYLPNTSTAFWTHLIKQIVKMQLAPLYIYISSEPQSNPRRPLQL